MAKQSGKFAEKLNLIQSEEIKVLRDALGAFHRQIQTQFVERKEDSLKPEYCPFLSWIYQTGDQRSDRNERNLKFSRKLLHFPAKDFVLSANRKSECKDFHIFTAECGLPFSMPVSKRKMLQSFVKQVAQFTFCRYVVLLEENLNLVLKKIICSLV